MTFALHCMTNQLASALAAATSITDHGVKVPVLKSLRIEVLDGAATIIATNTDQSVRAQVAADGAGLIHLDTLALTNKVRALRQDAPVAIEGDEKAVTISQGRTKWKLPAIYNTGFDFLATAAPIGGEPVLLPFDAFTAALCAAQPAFASDDRYYLAGASVEWDGEALRVVATDGHLLHTIQIPGAWPKRENMLIPPEAVNAMLKFYPPNSEIKMLASDSAFTLDDGDTLFKSKMIEGKFPDWRRIIPRTTGSTMVDAAEFIAALERVTAIREDESKSGKWVHVKLTLAPTEIVLTTQNRDGEEGTDYCAAEGGGEEYVVHVSANLILPALRSFGAVDTLRIEYGDETPRKTPPPLIIHRAAAKTDDFRLVNVLLG